MQTHSRSLAAGALAAALLAAGCGKLRSEQDPNRGLRLAIEAATVNSERRVEVTYRVTSTVGTSRGRSGLTNNWTLATLAADPTGVPGAQSYESLLLNAGQPVLVNGAEQRQPGSETENELTPAESLGDGRFKYTFSTVLPEGYPTGQTYRVGVFSQVESQPGQLPVLIEEDRPNVVFDFVPAGGTPQSRELVSEAACNTCHGEVRAHGGGRRGVAICTTCHTTQLYDPDTIDPALLDPSVVTTKVQYQGASAPANPLDLGRLVHRIHRGKRLQTVQNVLRAASPAGTPPAPPPNQAAILASPFARYAVVGFNDSVNTYGEARIRTENGVPSLGASGVAFPPPNDVRNCAQCHQGAKDAGLHLTTASRRACTGCHVDVWFEQARPVPEFHVAHTTNNGPGLGGLFANDQSCRACHSQEFAPVGAPEYGRYIGNAHVVPIHSRQLPGLSVEIIGFTVDSATRVPTIVFRLLNGNGSAVTDLAPFAAGAGGSLRATVVGPTRPDYQYFPNYFQENLQTGTLDAATGNWTHVFTGGAIPAGATGSWAVSIETRRTIQLANADEPTPPVTNVETSVSEGAMNPVRYFDPATGAVRAGEDRQMGVTQGKCNECHLDLEFHGFQRKSVEYCVMCHAPDLTDWGRRPKAGTGAEAVVNVAATPDAREERSAHFKVLIHRIHMGKGLELQKPFVVYGFTGAAFFDEGGLPAEGRLRCEKCHDGDRYKLEVMPKDRSPTFANETSAVLHAPGSADPKVPGVAGTPPMTAACIACHDTPRAVEHARNFVAARGERCLECHADRGIAAVGRVHGVPGAE